jgi:hypothetical protein
MSKGTQFTRTIQYFRTADLTEATACLQAATEVVASRAIPEVPTKRRGRPARPLVDTQADVAEGATA